MPAHRLPHVWPTDLPTLTLSPDDEERPCPGCGRPMVICDHRFRRLERFSGPCRIRCKLLRCPDPSCSARGKTFSPLAETYLAHPRWIVDWEVFAWIGHRRFVRHWTHAQIRDELNDSYRIVLSLDVLEDYVAHYERMVAAFHSDPVRLAALYANLSEVRLSIDGLQPEKGHETLYVVRELNAGIVWFAVPLLSSAASEVERVLERARQMADHLGKPVASWISDKQDAFVKGIAKLFPGVPHRFCKIHFVRALAADMMAQDRHIKTQLRSKVRGLRAIEREILETLPSGKPSLSPSTPEVPSSPSISLQKSGTSPSSERSLPSQEASSPLVTSPSTLPSDSSLLQDKSESIFEKDHLEDSSIQGKEVNERIQASIVLDYCAAIRGILNEDQGEALNPSGLRMATALEQVVTSLERCLKQKKTP